MGLLPYSACLPYTDAVIMQTWKAENADEWVRDLSVLL